MEGMRLTPEVEHRLDRALLAAESKRGEQDVLDFPGDKTHGEILWQPAILVIHADASGPERPTPHTPAWKGAAPLDRGSCPACPDRPLTPSRKPRASRVDLGHGRTPLRATTAG